MIELALTEYNYSRDHRLNDTLSGITNISLCVGEFVGPSVASFLCWAFGYGYASTIIGCIALLLAINYYRSSDAYKTSSKSEDASGKLIEMSS